MKRLLSFIMAFVLPAIVFGSEADLKIPNLSPDQNNMLMFGFVICFLGLLFGYYQFSKVKKLKAHKSMLDVAHIIFETCKTYLIQQGKFLGILYCFLFWIPSADEFWRCFAYPHVVGYRNPGLV